MSDVVLASLSLLGVLILVVLYILVVIALPEPTEYDVVYVDQSGSVMYDADLVSVMLSHAERNLRPDGTLMGFSGRVFPYHSDSRDRGCGTNIQACIDDAADRRALIITDGAHWPATTPIPSTITIMNIDPTTKETITDGR